MPVRVPMLLQAREQCQLPSSISLHIFFKEGFLLNLEINNLASLDG